MILLNNWYRPISLPAQRSISPNKSSIQINGYSLVYYYRWVYILFGTVFVADNKLLYCSYSHSYFHIESHAWKQCSFQSVLFILSPTISSEFPSYFRRKRVGMTSVLLVFSRPRIDQWTSRALRNHRRTHRIRLGYPWICHRLMHRRY